MKTPPPAVQTPAFKNKLVRVPALDPRGWLVPVLLVLGLLVAWLYHSVQGGGADYPRRTFLGPPEVRYSDMTNMFRMSSQAYPYRGVDRSAYPPAATFVYRHLAKASSVTQFALLLGLPLAVLISSPFLISPRLSLTSKGLVSVGIAASYPVWFAVDRGNLDLVVAVLLVVYYFGTRRVEERWRIGGVVALAIAVALKLYPFVFAAGLLVERRFRDFVSVVGLSVFLTIAALATFEGSVSENLQQFSASVGDLASKVNHEYIYARFSSSLDQALWILAQLGIRVPHGLIYGTVVLGMSTATLWFLSRLRSFSLDFYLLLAVPVVLLPALSNDYRLCVLLPFLLALPTDAPLRGARWVTTISVALLFVPKAYFPLLETQATKDLTLSSLINPALLLVLWSSACYSLAVGWKRTETPHKPGALDRTETKESYAM